jgi:uncharacterized OsmC-like protein
MSADLIRQTEEAWRVEPAKAKGTPTVQARTDGAQAVLEAGSFSWRADLPAALGGTNAAPSPTALLLSALAGCAAVFIRDTVAPQLGVEVRAVKATARCSTDARGLLGMSGAVPDLTDVELAIEIESPQSDEDVTRVFDVWRERCPVYLALIKPTSIGTSLKVVR